MVGVRLAELVMEKAAVKVEPPDLYGGSETAFESMSETAMAGIVAVCAAASTSLDESYAETM